MKSGTKIKGVSVYKHAGLTENDGHNDDLNDDDGVGWIEPWFDPF